MRIKVAIIASATVALAIANFVLVAVTIYYARLVRRQLKAGDMPEIAIFLYRDDHYRRNICIKNVGTGVARDLRFMTKNLYSDGKQRLDFLLENGIGYLEHGGEMAYYFTTKTAFDLTVSYRDSTNKEHECSFYLNPIESDNAVYEDKLGKISRELRDIKSELSKIKRKP